MYADPLHKRRIRPVSFGAALLVNTAIMGGLALFAAPSLLLVQHSQPTTVRLIPIDPDPPVAPPTPKPDTRQPTESRIVTPDPLVRTEQPPIHIDTTPVIPRDPPPIISLPVASDPVPVVLPPPPLIAAEIDPRYARDFQPTYPSVELRTGNEGRVSVRVRIGTDGRVKSVQKVSATSDAFFAATERQALAHWRFRPATRGGKPEESWKVLNVRFEMTGR